MMVKSKVYLLLKEYNIVVHKVKYGPNEDLQKHFISLKYVKKC